MNNYKSFAILTVFSMLVIFSTVWQGTYNIDPHHWGLMLSNAKDLSDGLLPYKDIFIQYGILTTVIQAVAYTYLGSNLLSIISVTAVFYALGLLGIYFLCLKVTNNRNLSLCAFSISCLFHLTATYPWSNYISFPFIIYGLFFLLELL